MKPSASIKAMIMSAVTTATKGPDTHRLPTWNVGRDITTYWLRMQEGRDNVQR